MENNLIINKIFDEKNLNLIANKGKYICILGAIGFVYSIVNKLIEKDYNLKIDISKNPKIEIYK